MLDIHRMWPFSFALVLAAGCAPPVPVARAPLVLSLPQIIRGDAAILTAEGRAAGLQGSVRARCTIGVRGMLHYCRLSSAIPLPQQYTIWLALDQWRLTPARSGGVAFATEIDVDIPLTAPPPDWSLPEVSPDRLRALRAAILAKPGPQDSAAKLPGHMDPPRLISGQPIPTYSREALARRAQGKVVARCVLTEVGTLEDCDVIKSVPLLDQSVLETLSALRYAPVLHEGKPQRRYYTLTFRFKAP